MVSARPPRTDSAFTGPGGEDEGVIRFSLAGIPVTVRPSFWLVAVLLGWSVTSSLSIHPHYLSYFNELAGALTGRQAYQAEAYIYELGKYEGKMSEVHRYLRSTDARIRARMARIVGDIADPSSRPLIEELTRDKDPEVASEAIVALRKLTPA